MRILEHTRRRFLRYLATAPAAIWSLAAGERAVSAEAGDSSPVPKVSSISSSTKVVVATRASAGDAGGNVNGGEVARLLNDSIVAATGRPDAGSAWKSLFSSKDVVGVKVNSLAGHGLSSHPELVAAVVDGLSSAGVPREKIIVWDRQERELVAAGFSTAGMKGARLLATDSPGVGYEREIDFSGEVGSCFSRVLSHFCTAIINIPVLKDHDLSGVSLGMKSFYGAIHNPNKYHDNGCDPYIADLNAHPFIAKKVRLTICDGLKGQYHGGPAFREQWSWPAATLIVGTDPVAVDRVGWEIIEQKRRESGMPSLKDAGREPSYILTGDKRGLGTGDLGRILVKAIS